MTSTIDSRRGFWATVAAFFIWGLFPIYWKLLASVPALQIIAHRLVWCGVFTGGYLFWRYGWSWLRQLARQPRLIGTLAVTGLLIATNWGLYIWAVTAGHVMESALGYFITPLINVLLAVLVLKETLTRGQQIAVAFATAGVLWLTVQYGQLPWIALTLATSFGCYGLLRKRAVVDPLAGLAVESAWLLPVMLGLMLWWEAKGIGRFGHEPLALDGLLVLGGLITAIPLVLFAYGARRIPLTTVGLVQYLAPTIQFFCGLWLYHEPFNQTRAIGFALIWAGCAVYLGESLWRGRRPI